MKIRCFQFSLPFKYPFTTARGTKTHQPTFVVELELFGLKGYGEAPAIAYYDIPVEKMVSDLAAKKNIVEKYAFQEPERFWHFLHHLFPNNNFLVCALDIAAWDLYGKMRGKPLHDLWELDISRNPVTDYTIGMDTIDKMVEKMQAQPWPVYKVKMGWENDIDMIRALRKHTSVPIRVDVNSGWTVAEAKTNIPLLKELDIEFIEEPITRFDYEGMKELYPGSQLPLFADESCVKEQDVEKCAGAFHGINIKLTKCSGITPARRMIDKARELNLKVMIGCMNESTIGSAAIAHLLPLLDYADMDGSLLLTEDLATGIIIENGRVGYSGGNGLGIDFLRNDAESLI